MTKKLSKPIIATVLIVCVVSISGFIQVHAVGVQLTQTFLSPMPASDTFFGFSVASFDKKIIVGAPFDNTAGTHAGAAYLLNASNGALLRTFLSPTPNSEDLFGLSVAAIGNKILVGEPFVNAGAQGSGAAYLFDSATGLLIRTFVNPVPTPFAEFGLSVAAMKNHVGESSGRMGVNILVGGVTAAYLFDGVSGVLLHTFHDPNPTPGDGFGSKVVPVDGNVLVGALFASSGGTSAGAAYLFDSNTGNLLQTFLNPIPIYNGEFGLAMGSIKGNVIISAPQDVANGIQAGVVFVFNATSGTLVRTIPDPTPDNINQFGRSITVNGNDIVIGAPGDSTAAINAGAIYRFDGSSFGLVQTVLDPNPGQQDSFGQSLFSIGGNILVGAPHARIAGQPAGAVYLYKMM